MLATSTFLALAMQCAPSIHPDTSHDVARIESSFNPYAIGVVGQKGYMPRTKEEALSIVDRLKKEGKNYSVGLMQINHANFKKQETNADALFDPCKNLLIFEKIITECYQRGKTLKNALSCYYSGNFNTGKKKEKAFASTSYVERIGYSDNKTYLVPSTKKDKDSEHKKEGVKIIYPKQVLRGQCVENDIEANRVLNK